MGAFTDALLAVLPTIENMIYVLVAASVICSWVGADPNNPIVQMIYKTTEPMFRPFRKILGNLIPAIDLSPIALILVTKFIFQFIYGILRRVGQGDPVGF
jgi:YggT family protein